MPEAIIFEKEKFQSFIAVKEFSLNFDSPQKIGSQKIKVGMKVSYDGETVSFINLKDQEITGKASSLKAAIIKAGWLIPCNADKKSKKKKIIDVPQVNSVPRTAYDDKKGGDFNVYAEKNIGFANKKGVKNLEVVKEESTEIKRIKPIVDKNADYDAARGGNFDSFVNKEIGKGGQIEAHIQKPGERQIKFDKNIVRENDRIAKELSFNSEKNTEQKVKGKLEIAGDQIDVKDLRASRLVNSSTVNFKETKRKFVVEQRDSAGTEVSQHKSIDRTPKDGTRKSFVVDDQTPRNIAEGATLSEISKMKRQVIAADSAQDASVVKSISVRRDRKEVEGITFRENNAPHEISLKTKVSSGYIDMPVEADVAGTVVAKIAVRTETTQNNAKAKAEARKKAVSKVTEELLKNSPKITPKVLIKAEVIEEDNQVEGNDYLDRLPENWSDLHWVQKEKFIKSLTDVGFIEFILSVEIVTAVQNACQERLIELKK